MGISRQNFYDWKASSFRGRLRFELLFLSLIIQMSILKKYQNIPMCKHLEIEDITYTHLTMIHLTVISARSTAFLTDCYGYGMQTISMPTVVMIWKKNYICTSSNESNMHFRCYCTMIYDFNFILPVCHNI